MSHLKFTIQVTDARDITDIKCKTLIDCYHLHLFSDKRKVRAIGASPQFALAIRATYVFEMRRRLFEIACMSVSQVPRCWLALSFTSLLSTDTQSLYLRSIYKVQVEICASQN
jgi:hypothetical protein